MYRRTKLHATLGPASGDEATLRELIAAGLDGCRINFSHAQPDDAARLVALVRRLAAEAGRPVAIRQDLQGPRIRVGRMPASVELVPGARVRLVPEGAYGHHRSPLQRGEGTRRALPGEEGAERRGNVEGIPIDCPELFGAVGAGAAVLLDEGQLEVRVERAEVGALMCQVVHGGWLQARKGLNLPGVRLPLPALTEKDAADLAVGVRLGVDFVSLSFVQRAEDVRLARARLRALGGEGVRLVAKIEKSEALADLEAILDEVDGVSVARGDLGLEVGPENLPAVQRQVVAACRRRGRMVQVGGEVLHTMIRAPRPTRSEVADVWVLVEQGVDGISLSGETAVGAHPVAALATLDRIVRRAEQDLDQRGPAPQPVEAASPEEAVAASLARRGAPIAVRDPGPSTGWLNCFWGVCGEGVLTGA